MTDMKDFKDYEGQGKVHVGDKTYDSLEEMFRDRARRQEERPWYQKKYDSLKFKADKVRVFFQIKIPEGTRNLIKYFPIVWNDRDFDHSYLFNLMAFKMYQMAELHEHHGVTVDHKETADELRYAAKLAEELGNGDYDLTPELETKTKELFGHMERHIHGWWNRGSGWR